MISNDEISRIIADEIVKAFPQHQAELPHAANDSSVKCLFNGTNTLAANIDALTATMERTRKILGR